MPMRCNDSSKFKSQSSPMSFLLKLWTNEFHHSSYRCMVLVLDLLRLKTWFIDGISLLKSVKGKKFHYSSCDSTYFRQNYCFRHGIEVVGVSSDGDPKLLAAMCAKMCNVGRPIVVTQDHIHFGNKCRNRLLHKVHLPMGKYEVSINHLQSLVRDVQKSVHGLSQMDITPVDRMNHASFEKISSERTLEALQKHIKNSDATIQYLRVCRDATLAYLEIELSPIERIHKIWHALFFIRIWRDFITSSNRYTLKENFLTTNAYMCLEINARSLVQLIKKFRDEGHPERFLPRLFDSQGCENIFRLFRSLGTTQFTKITFSIYEFLHMIRRVEAQIEIAYVKLADQEIHFPNKRKGKAIIFDLPSDKVIDETIAKAKDEAIQNALKLGMSTTTAIDDFQIKTNIKFDEDDYSEFPNDEDIEAEMDMEMDVDEFDADELNSDNMVVDINSRYVVVRDEDGFKRKILKQTYLWMLIEPSEKISNERWIRVQVCK